MCRPLCQDTRVQYRTLFGAVTAVPDAIIAPDENDIKHQPKPPSSPLPPSSAPPVAACIFSMLAIFGLVVRTVSFLLFVSVSVSAQPFLGSTTKIQRDFSPDEKLTSSPNSRLPLQVGGIAASYVIFDAFVVLLLLVVGRRLRREAHSSNYTLEMVMLGPTRNKLAKSIDPSPVSDYSVDSQIPSPTKPRGWNMSWSNVKGHHAQQASINSSVATIDDSVVSADRRRAQEEMEYLYAAVMEHDAKKASTHNSPVVNDNSSDTPLASPGIASRFPDAYQGQGQGQFQQSQLSPQYQFEAPLSPRQGSTKSRASQRLSKLSNLSIFSPGSRSSANSNKLKSPRDLPISSPIKSPNSIYHDTQPLSPRIYNPGPPPTAPLPELNNDSSNSIATRAGFNLQPISTPNSSFRPNAPSPISINAGGSNSSLPFRQQFNPPMSAPHTKTTILERPVNAHGGPRTGMPTPYSPYMPFTPVTPLTPSRLVTKRDRKKQSKAQGLKVLHEDDMVKNDDDLWGT